MYAQALIQLDICNFIHLHSTEYVPKCDVALIFVFMLSNCMGLRAFLSIVQQSCVTKLRQYIYFI